MIQMTLLRRHQIRIFAFQLRCRLIKNQIKCQMAGYISSNNHHNTEHHSKKIILSIKQPFFFVPHACVDSVDCRQQNGYLNLFAFDGFNLRCCLKCVMAHSSAALCS